MDATHARTASLLATVARLYTEKRTRLQVLAMCYFVIPLSTVYYQAIVVTQSVRTRS